MVFDDHTEVDLGGRTVQLWHFGPGNTVVWVAEARMAWTGNLLGHRRVAPMLLEDGPPAAALVHEAAAPAEAVGGTTSRRPAAAPRRDTRASLKQPPTVRD